MLRLHKKKKFLPTQDGKAAPALIITNKGFSILPRLLAMRDCDEHIPSVHSQEERT